MNELLHFRAVCDEGCSSRHDRRTFSHSNTCGVGEIIHQHPEVGLNFSKIFDHNNSEEEEGGVAAVVKHGSGGEDKGVVFSPYVRKTSDTVFPSAPATAAALGQDQQPSSTYPSRLRRPYPSSPIQVQNLPRRRSLRNLRFHLQPMFLIKKGTLQSCRSCRIPYPSNSSTTVPNYIIQFRTRNFPRRLCPCTYRTSTISQSATTIDRPP
jgi:hypothetical protein